MYNLTKPWNDAMSDFKGSDDEKKGSVATPNIEGYFVDLKKRLNNLREQHNNVIEHSVVIMKEIDNISGSLLRDAQLQQMSGSFPDIKKIIKEFEHNNDESIKKLKQSKNKDLVINEIARNINETTQKEVICNDLELFKKTKDTFRHIENFLSLKQRNYQNNLKKIMKLEKENQKDKKIHIYEKNNRKQWAVRTNPTHFSRNQEANDVDDGYDGDVDSEYEKSFNFCNYEPKRQKIN